MIASPSDNPGVRRLIADVTRGRDLGDGEVRERLAHATWSTLCEPGDGAAGAAISAFGAEDALRRLVDGTLTEVPGIAARTLRDAMARWTPRLAPDAVESALRIASAAGVGLVIPGDEHWPAALGDLGAHGPICLWVRGDTSALSRLEPSVALVGARAATSYGEHVTSELAAELAGSGIPIISGAAYGIDGVAHRAALAVGGQTVALLAGGADRPYPAGHAQLIERISTHGVVVSEVPCGAAPTRWRFLQRNRIIAALSTATVVVEAGWRSGSLNTAGHAAQLGRALGAVPGPITSAASAGTHRLLREYAATCVTSADDVRDMLGIATGGSTYVADGRPDTDQSSRVRDALSARVWRDAADLARRSGLSVGEVEGVLGLLRLDGVAESGSSGWRLLTPGSAPALF
jgi:DNA processing protein